MARDRDGVVAGGVISLFRGGSVAGLTDGQLLDRFASRGGEEAESAFATLVERHGPMVLRTSRMILGRGHDPRDAFQATFLILARRAGSIWVGDSLGPWLHRVACRVAVRACQAERRRRVAERGRAEVAGTWLRPRPADDLADRLHEEIDRLPDRFRVVVILCDLEGFAYEEAARRLGCPVGTIKSRLARGRDRLRDRLARRDPVADRPVPLAILAPLPSRWADPTTRAALAFRSGPAGAMSVPAAARILAEGGLRSMTIQKMARIACALLATGLASAGTALVARQAAPAPAAVQAPTPASPDDPAARREREAAWRRRSSFNLRTISLGLAQYSNKDGAYPPTILEKPGDGPPHSWRVAILPFMGQQDLYDQYHFDEAWDGPRNRELLARMPAAFRAPGDDPASTDTGYFALTGLGAIFSDLERTRPSGIPDGAGNTILIVESKRAVPWTRPDDIRFTPDRALPRLGGFYTQDVPRGSFFASFADGSVRFIPGDIGEPGLRALISKAGREEVKLP